MVVWLFGRNLTATVSLEVSVSGEFELTCLFVYHLDTLVHWLVQLKAVDCGSCFFCPIVHSFVFDVNIQFEGI